MRTWKRLSHDTICGGPCGRQLNIGDPILEFKIASLTQAKIRCAQCAGEAVPPDLPARVVERVEIQPTPMIRAGRVKLPFEIKRAPVRDYKIAAAGREVGEEG